MSALAEGLKIMPIQSSIAFQVKPEIKGMCHTTHAEFSKCSHRGSAVARDEDGVTTMRNRPGDTLMLSQI